MTHFPALPPLPDPSSPLRKIRESLDAAGEQLSKAVDSVHGVKDEAKELRKTLSSKAGQVAGRARRKQRPAGEE